MTDQHYQDLLASQRPRTSYDGATIDLIAGTVGNITSAAANNWPISGAVVTVEPGKSLDYAIPALDRAFLYVLSGAIDIAGRHVTAGQVAWSEPMRGADTSSICLSAADADADEPTVVMVYSGAPIAEPVEFGGPFVMNSKVAARAYGAASAASMARRSRADVRQVHITPS